MPSWASIVGSPPRPLIWLSTQTSATPSGVRVLHVMGEVIDSEQAGTRSGTTFARAPKTTSATRASVSARLHVAAGSTGLTKVPGRAVTDTARNRPALAGIVAPSTHCTAVIAPAKVEWIGQLMGPR